MAVSLKHSFNNPKSDGPDSTVVRPSDWNAEHVLTLGTNRVLGRVSSGTGAVEELTGAQVRSIADVAQLGVLGGINTRTASYTLALSDRGKLIEMNVSGANTVTIPNETGIGGVNFPIGSQILVVQTGTGTTTLSPAAGVTIQSTTGGLTTVTRYSAVLLYKRASNNWIVVDQATAHLDGRVDNLETVAGGLSNVATVATNIGSVNTAATNIAGINNVSAAINNGDLLTDVYQGAAITDPALRLTGAALQNGDFYFNTSTNRTRTYANGVWYDAYPGGNTNASLVTFDPNGTGAVSRTAQSKMRDIVSVLDFGADPTGASDSSAAIQAAINSGLNLVIPAGTYKANNLTGSTNFQRFYAYGQATIVKNANGPLFSHSGMYIELNGITFNGDATTPVYTGDNIVLTGNSPRLINCGSQWAYGRALYATGSQVQVLGTCAAYFTADTSPTAYDIEIGVSGTATLYHELIGIYTSQSTGGVKLIDTGSHTLIGGQIGKLWIASGTAPAGVNGGMTSNMRILGNVLVELSNAVFTGNQFNTQTVTFAAGTSGHVLDATNSASGITLVNNGNGNSNLVRSVGTGSPAGIILSYGASGLCQIRYDNDLVSFQNQNVALANNKSLRWFDSGGTLRTGMSLSSGDDWFVGNDSGTGNFTIVSSGSQGVYLGPSGTAAFIAESGAFRPTTDGTANLGASGNRFSTVYASTGTINTSDEREKDDIRALTEAEARVARKIRPLLKAYKWRSDIATKGDRAKTNFGVVAQDVMKAFEDEGLDALDYGVVVHDKWEAAEAIERDGQLLEPARAAGDRYGVRYDQLFAFILAVM